MYSVVHTSFYIHLQTAFAPVSNIEIIQLNYKLENSYAHYVELSKTKILHYRSKFILSPT